MAKSQEGTLPQHYCLCNHIGAEIFSFCTCHASCCNSTIVLFLIYRLYLSFTAWFYTIVCYSRR